MLPVSQIQQPTCLLDKTRVMQNIRRMAQKASHHKVTFRPHFKTHQSADIGQWFRIFGVKAITVSSLHMAHYFAGHGWQDITVAFPVNIREMERINHLAQVIRLHLLVDSEAPVKVLQERLAAPVRLWIKIDVGYGRAGIRWDRPDKVLSLARLILESGNTPLAGLLTHAGHTYAASSAEEIRHIYRVTVERLSRLREMLAENKIGGVNISVGDTPGCVLTDDFGPVDEIRPGNFVFYDAMQLHLGVCQEEQIGVAVACPVVALYPDRQEMILYGGAVHLSKDFICVNGEKVYGWLAPLTEKGWGRRFKNTYLRALSQEHGIVATTPEILRQFQVGDLVAVIPVHSCLTVNLLRRYMTLDGEPIPMMPL